MKKCPSNQIAAPSVEQDKENDHHEKTILSDELKVGRQNACDLSNEHQNQSPKHGNQNQSLKHENHNKKLRVNVDAEIVERWKKKWKEEKQTNEELARDANNVTTPKEWIANHVVHRFADVLNNDKQCKYEISHSG